MKIAVNVAWMAPGHSGGMEWYVRALIDELGAVDQRNEYLLITSPMNHDTFEALPSGWQRLLYHGDEASPSSFRATPFMHQADDYKHLDSLLAERGVELLFCPLLYALPAHQSIPVVVTIPDLQHEHLPELFEPFERASRAIGFQDVTDRATAILGISQFVADDIVDHFDVDPSRVVATPLGLNPDFVVDEATVERYADAARVMLRIEHPFLYYPSNAWPHKNHGALLDAFEQVRSELPDLRLILSGDRAVAAGIPAHMEDVVTHAGYVPREIVVGLLSAATALVFPSRFEGFGLPLLEAMAVGTPAICSDLPALREVGGEAVRYFDPESVDAIGEAIVDIATDDDLRARLVKAGADRVSQFSYRRTAERTKAVFGQIESGQRTSPNQQVHIRPVDGRGDLYDGHAQWRLRVGAPRTIDLEVAANPYAPTGHSHDPVHLVVAVDGQVAGEILLEFGGSGRTVSLAMPATVPQASAHTIDIVDLTADRRASIGRVQLISLTVDDARLGEVRIL